MMTPEQSATKRLRTDLNYARKISTWQSLKDIVSKTERLLSSAQELVSFFEILLYNAKENLEMYMEDKGD